MTACVTSAARARSIRCWRRRRTAGSTSWPAARDRSGSPSARAIFPTRPPPSSSSRTAEEAPDVEAAAAAREVYAELVRACHRSRTRRTPTSNSMTAYGMAATVDFGLEAKQGLLELRSENARMALVTRLFRAAFKRLDFVDRAQTRARSNGKVRF